MQFFAKEIIVDQQGKATNFRLHSLQYPHMRGLHLAWISCMVAFLSWYSIPPIMHYIAEDLKISGTQVHNSNVVSVSSTIIPRLVIGPLCERFGPRRVMAGLLLIGSIPCATTGLLQNAEGLIVLRFVIGIIGAAFVPTQFWATQMFAPSVVGTANALTGGWGDMGGGVTYVFMHAIFDGFRRHLPISKAWRVVFIFPAAICIIVGIADLVFGTDTPQGDWLRKQETDAEAASEASQQDSVEDEAKKNKDKDENNVMVKEVPRSASITDVKRNESSLVVIIDFLKVFSNPAVLLIVAAYACTLGIELAIVNVIGHIFRTKFDLDPSTAAYIGSIFGLLNLFSRLTGGLISDFMAYRFQVPGRILALLLSMLLQGAFLIGFAYSLISLKVSITVMVFFSFFVQHACGSTFAIVPFVDPVNNGKIMGIVGAGGNLGGLLFNLMFGVFGDRYRTAFLCLGCITLGVAVICGFCLRVQKKSIWDLFQRT